MKRNTKSRSNNQNCRQLVIQFPDPVPYDEICIQFGPASCLKDDMPPSASKRTKAPRKKVAKPKKSTVVNRTSSQTTYKKTVKEG